MTNEKKNKCPPTVIGVIVIGVLAERKFAPGYFHPINRDLVRVLLNVILLLVRGS